VSGTGTILAGDVIADMANNILDGDDDDVAGGDKTWSFATTDEIDLDAPYIVTMEDPNDVSLTEPIKVTFSEAILSSSVNSASVGISPAINYWSGLSSSTTISISHSKFDPSSIYTTTLNSGIQDLRQNCWYPCDCSDEIANGGAASCVCNNATCSGDGENCTGTNL